MNFLADECVDERLVRILEQAGHDIRSAKIDLRGAADAVLLEAAVRSTRCLITEDKDFGQLALTRRPPPAGIILIRSHKASVDEVGRQLLQAVGYYGERLHGLFLVVHGKRCRARALD